MAKFFTLASSSSGNASYISCANTSILVDAGITCKRLVNGLKENDCAVEKVDAVLITHEHLDHIKGLRLFLQKSGASVCATKLVLEKLIDIDAINANTPLVEVGTTPFMVGDLEIQAFKTSHDSVDSVGYKILTSDSHTISIATDLGIVTDEVLNAIKGSEIALLESNYDATLLRMGNYPYFLKERISSNNGHLENNQCCDLAKKLLSSGTTRFVLGHLSKHNNTPSLAQTAMQGALREYGAVENVDYTLVVSPYDDNGKIIRF